MWYVCTYLPMYIRIIGQHSIIRQWNNYYFSFESKLWEMIYLAAPSTRVCALPPPVASLKLYVILLDVAARSTNFRNRRLRRFYLYLLISNSCTWMETMRPCVRWKKIHNIPYEYIMNSPGVEDGSFRINTNLLTWNRKLTRILQMGNKDRVIDNVF